MVYICASIIFVLMAGISIACLLMARSTPRSKPTNNAIRLYRPCRQRRATLKRATLNARLMVAGGTIDIPARRRA